jgi:hypothetical protein
MNTPLIKQNSSNHYRAHDNFCSKAVSFVASDAKQAKQIAQDKYGFLHGAVMLIDAAGYERIVAQF